MLRFKQLHPNQQLKYVIQAGLFKYFHHPESAIAYLKHTNPSITTRWLKQTSL